MIPAVCRNGYRFVDYVHYVPTFGASMCDDIVLHIRPFVHNRVKLYVIPSGPYFSFTVLKVQWPNLKGWRMK